MHNHFLTLLANTVQKEYRSKTLIFVFLITLGIIYGINGLVDYTASNSAGMAGGLDLLFLITSVWSCLLGAIFGTSCIRSDQDERVFAQILAFPVNRHHYLLARLLGAWLIVMVYYLITLGLATALFAVTSHSLQVNPSLLPALMLTGLAILATILIGTLISLFMTRIPALLGTLAIIITAAVANAHMHDTILSSNFLLSTVQITLPHIGTIEGLARGMLKGGYAEVNHLFEALHYLISCSLLYIAIFITTRRQEP